MLPENRPVATPDVAAHADAEVETVDISLKGGLACVPMNVETQQEGLGVEGIEVDAA